MKRIRMTMAQALVKFLDVQYIRLDDDTTKFVEGVFTIFGHGCCVGLGEALSQSNHNLTVYQGHNEQGMAHAATAYAKEKNRRGILPCISSIGPGATNMVTAAATATVNRLPLLLLPGDTFACRQPDPVLQQLETPHDLSLSVNDVFKPVSKFWDRITRPEQLMTSLINAMRVLCDPRETGAVCVALSQDVQGEVYAYPDYFFNKRVHVIERQTAAPARIAEAAAALKAAKRPVVICGGGVRYSEAHDALLTLIENSQIPFVETQAGKSVLPSNHPLNLGGVGVTGTLAANQIIRNADCLLAIGTRLNDFITASKSAFNADCRFISINVSPFDAAKLDSITIIADAKTALSALSAELGGGNVTTAEHTAQAKQLKRAWATEVATLETRQFQDDFSSFSQMAALRQLNSSIPADAIVVAASGSLPGDMERLWETRKANTYHLEYGYSCMGYEVAGAFGVKLAQPNREVYAIVGDGAYLLMHSELFTSIQERQKINIILFDNAGFHCIDNLQRAQGIKNFACEFRYRETQTNSLSGAEVPVDYALNARSYGCQTWTVRTQAEFSAALHAAQKSRVSTLIELKVAKKSMTGGYETWWRVGTPELSATTGTQQAFAELKAKRERELRDY